MWPSGKAFSEAILVDIVVEKGRWEVVVRGLSALVKVVGRKRRVVSI